jgi:hypothetical protein
MTLARMDFMPDGEHDLRVVTAALEQARDAALEEAAVMMERRGELLDEHAALDQSGMPSSGPIPRAFATSIRALKNTGAK